MNARSPLSLLLLSFATLSAGCMTIVPNGYITEQRVEIIRGSVRDPDKQAVTYEVERCVGRLNGITHRLKAIRNTRTVLSVVGGTATVVSGITGLLLPEGSRDQKLATGVVTAASGLLVLLGSILGNSDAEAKVNLAGQSLFDSAQAVADRLQARRHLSTLDNPEDIRLLKALLRQCGNISTYSSDIKEVSATEGVDQSTVDNINKMISEANALLDGMKAFQKNIDNFKSQHPNPSSITDTAIESSHFEEELGTSRKTKQVLGSHAATLLNMAIEKYPYKLSILQSSVFMNNALSQSERMLTEIESAITQILKICKSNNQKNQCEDLANKLGIILL